MLASTHPSASAFTDQFFFLPSLAIPTPRASLDVAQSDSFRLGGAVDEPKGLSMGGEWVEVVDSVTAIVTLTFFVTTHLVIVLAPFSIQHLPVHHEVRQRDGDNGSRAVEGCHLCCFRYAVNLFEV